MVIRSVAVCGLGGMGAGMAASLLRAGFMVTVYNRTPAKARTLIEAGAVAADTPERARDAGVVLLSLADENAVTEVLFGSGGIASALSPGRIVVDTSTVSPSFARGCAARLAAVGLKRVEACVIGNPAMAEAGRLRVFTAGDESEVDEVRPMLGALGQEVRHLGGRGSASSLKLAFNLLLGVQTAGLAEAVALAEAGGLDRELVLTVLSGAGWGAPALAFRSKFMRDRTYAPAAFRSVLMHKDLRLAEREAEDRGLALPLLNRVREEYERIVSDGRGDEDAAVLVDHRPVPNPVVQT